MAGAYEFYPGSINKIEENFDYRVSPLNFFARYCKDEEFNYKIHKNPKESLNGWNNHTNMNFQAPYWEGEIDLIHMFASIDIGLEWTNGGNPSANMSTIKLEKDLGSWGGDLQSVCNKFLKKEISFNTYNNFSKIIENDDLGMGEADFYADVDAINILDVLTDNTASELSNKINDYYAYYPQFGYDRIHNFISNVSKEPSIKWNSNNYKDIFRKEVHFLLGRQWDDNSQSYIDANLNSPFFSIMTENAGENIDASIRDKLADMFADYVLTL